MKFDSFDPGWSMTRQNWVCFKCRHTSKKRPLADVVNCPTCRIPMVNLGFNHRLPLKGNDKAWRLLEERYHSLKPLVPSHHRKPRKGRRTHP